MGQASGLRGPPRLRSGFARSRPNRLAATIHKPDCPPLGRPTRRAAVVLALLVLAFACAPAVACADGDPASDVLIDQDAFLPWDAGANAAQQGQLGAVLAAAARSGYPIRVAIIPSSSDLGSIAELWGRPQTYARFLDVELSDAYQGRVLVVMPNGFGLASTMRLLPAEQQVIAQVPPPRTRSELTTDAEATITKLATAAGHPFHTSAVPASAPARPSSGSGGAVPLIVFILGAVMIAVAWAASLRGRPLRLRGRHQPAG